MHWQTKAALQAALSRVPYGARIYRWLQDRHGALWRTFPERYRNKVQVLHCIRRHDLPIAGRSFLEIGTGWQPVMPLLLHLLGAERVETLDINPWLTSQSLHGTLRRLRDLGDRVASDLGLDPSRCAKTLEGLLAASAEGSRPLQEVLSLAGIRYVMPGDATRTGYDSGTFDYVLSCDLMEHVPPPVIRGMLRESKRVLKPGGAHLHHISMGDHFAPDADIRVINFLKYSPRAWYFIGGSGLAYHNRLRAPDYLRLWESEGLEPFCREVEVDAKSLRALEEGSVKPHPTFAGYSPEELCAYTLNLFARSAGSSRGPAPKH